MILEIDIAEHQGPNSVFLFDEYYHALVRTKLRYNNKKQLNPIFGLGIDNEAYLSTGHKSPEYERFVAEYFSGKASYQVNDSMMSMAGGVQPYVLTVRAHPSLSMAQAAAIVQVQKLAKFKPVILFGYRWNEGERFGLGQDYPVKQVSLDDNIDHIREFISSSSRGVIGLPIECFIGLDLRF